MSKFKVGDKVVRVQENSLLVTGSVYTVQSLTSTDWVRLVGVVGHSFNPDNFELVEDTSKRRPHYDLIIAWANGAEVECKYYPTNDWTSVNNPSWLGHFEYRIKPTNPEKEKLEQLISDMDKQLTDAKNRLKEIAGE